MDIPTTIELRVGEVHKLKLPGLGTAGYVWTFAIEDCNLIAVTAGKTERSQPANSGELSSVGSSVDESFTILALKPGRTNVHFAQRRPWEGEQTSLREQTLEVNIKMSN